MAQVQPERVKTWLNRLEEFLTDEFHYELYRVISETHWGSDIMIGAWTGPMEFFACLENQREFIIANHNKPAHISSHLQSLNFSGTDLSSGVGNKFWADQLPKNRQNILLLHSLRLILENNEKGRVNLNLIVPIIRREIHQCIRLVFFHLKNGPHAKWLNDFIDEITQYQWLPMSDVRQRLANYVVLWLEQQGVERSDIDDSKLGKFWGKLTEYIHYRPGQTEPVEFKYGHLFSDWQKYGFFSTMIYEIDRFGSLVNLESLNHSSRSTTETAIVDQLQASYEKRAKGGTRYQSILAIHYLLKCVKVKDNNTKKADFASFLTGYSENTLRQNWSNIHRKGDEKNTSWENDMRIVREHFEALGLSEVVKLIDSDLTSQKE